MKNVTVLLAAEGVAAGSGVVSELENQQLADNLQQEELDAHKPENQGLPPEPAAFDPSKVDVNDPTAMSNLSDEELSKVTQYNVEHPAPEAPETAEQVAAAAAEKALTDATRYAGKYATTDALVKGVNEIAKKVGVDVTAFVEAAKESGEFKSLESLYKRMAKTLGEKGAVVAATQDNPAKPPATGTVEADTFDPEEPATKNAVDQLTISQLANSTLAQRMRAKGLEMPKDMTEFDQLAEVNAYFANAVEQAYKELFTQNMEQAKGYFNAKKTFEGTNASVVASDTESLKALATEQGFTLTDEELAAVKQAALANPNSYETKYGHKFLRPNAVRDHFLVNALPAKLGEIKLAQQAAGRTQAVTDLEKARKKEVGGIGTAKIASKTRQAGKMPDVSDPAVLESMPDEILNYPGGPEAYYLSKGFTKR